jgi:hypothetical protein
MQSEYGIDFDETFDCIRVMSTHEQRKLWKLVGVPQNDYSLMVRLLNLPGVCWFCCARVCAFDFDLPTCAVFQNAAILAQPSRWPLVIDPQGMTAVWMTRLEEAAGRKVAHVTSGEPHLGQVRTQPASSQAAIAAFA